MSTALKIIQELLPLQDAFNRKVNPDWLNAGYPFHRAIWMEAAEYVEGTNAWKWWKAPGPFQLKQLQLEVIDKLHFLMSWGLVEEKRLDSPGLAGEAIAGSIEAHGDKPHSEFKPELAIAITEALVHAASGKDFLKTADHFCALALVSQLSLTDMRRMYIGKNALNTVRNLNGYKEGTYQKTWDGEEDNIHLERLMAEQPDLPFQQLIDTLTQRYKAIHA